METYTLNITFTGLCLFVPEPAGADQNIGTMTVLMPMLGAQHHHGMDRHVPVLGFDTAHAVATPADRIRGAHAYVSMSNLQLIHMGSEANLSLCPEMVNLAEVTRRPVEADHLGPDTTTRLVSRVRLGAGRINAVARGVCWEWGQGRIRSIAHKVQWTIDGIPGTDLKLRLLGLHSGTAVQVPILYPINGAINLFVHHVPQGDLLPEPENHHEPQSGAEPHHFAAFYNLFGADPPMRLPRYAGKSCSPSTTPCTEIPEIGASAFTCMVAAAKMT